MQYKRRNVRVYRDFPKGCGVICRKFNVGESLMPSNFKAYGDLPHIKRALETETCRIAVCNSKNGSLTDESLHESDGDFEDPEEEEVIGECEDKLNQTSPVKKRRRLSLDNSTIEVGTDVVNTSKRVLVSGLAAPSKYPWSQPKNKRSKQGKRRWKL